jgi:hypothetical protein
MPGRCRARAGPLPCGSRVETARMPVPRPLGRLHLAFGVDREIELHSQRCDVRRRGAQQAEHGIVEITEAIVKGFVLAVRSGIERGFGAAEAGEGAVPHRTREGRFPIVTPDPIRGPPFLCRRRREEGGSRIKSGMTGQRHRAGAGWQRAAGQAKLPQQPSFASLCASGDRRAVTGTYLSPASRAVTGTYLSPALAPALDIHCHQHCTYVAPALCRIAGNRNVQNHRYTSRRCATRTTRMVIRASSMLATTR